MTGALAPFSYLVYNKKVVGTNKTSLVLNNYLQIIYHYDLQLLDKRYLINLLEGMPSWKGWGSNEIFCLFVVNEITLIKHKLINNGHDVFIVHDAHGVNGVNLI